MAKYIKITLDVRDMSKLLIFALAIFASNQLR